MSSAAAGLPLVLASVSPRRRALLEGAGIAFEAVDPGVEEKDGPADPATLALGHAAAKAGAGARLRPGRYVLGADTVVVVDGTALGKPADAEEADAMLARLLGREHEVLTAQVLVDPGGAGHARVERARVRFGAVPEEELRSYLAGEEWRDKAGAYGIQGWAGRWAEVVAGDPETVVGLSTAGVRWLLEHAAGCAGCVPAYNLRSSSARGPGGEDPRPA